MGDGRTNHKYEKQTLFRKAQRSRTLLIARSDRGGGAKRTLQIRKPEKCCCFHHFRGEAPPWPCSAGDEAAPRCVPADLALLRSHLRDQVASIPRAAASAALQPHLSRMFLTVWVGLAQVSRALAEQLPRLEPSRLLQIASQLLLHPYPPTHVRR